MNDSYSVTYSHEALNDLKDIYEYIAQELLAPNTAKKQVNRIRKEVRSLAFMPSRYALVNWEPWERMGMRKVSVDHFMVFYIVDSNAMTVTIIRIVYGGRDMESLAKAGHTALQSGTSCEVQADQSNPEPLSAILESESIARDPSMQRYSDVEDALWDLKQ